MKTLPCPDCGRAMRPCNMVRHRRAKHLPKISKTRFGKRFTKPPMPIRLGKEKDRRYDEFAPRGEGPERFRIYRLRAGDLELIATVGKPEAIGVALTTLYSEGEFITDDAVGLLDTATDPGHWIVHPFALGRRREEDA